MSIESYFTLFYIFLGLSILFLCIIVFIFFKFNIGRAILEITGIAKVREMQNYEYHATESLTNGTDNPRINLKSPSLHGTPLLNTSPSGFSSSPIVPKDFKPTDTDVLNLDLEEPKPISHTEDLEIQEPDVETSVLDISEPENSSQQATGTTVLSNGTTVLSICEEDESYISSTEII